ncbi:MAG: F0F1 ATP synthase subunit beta, partial [Planctomycetaceae bacterium]|nr:F0F1 ATP synthase subunit beta [Planctomycetaceae bacterium]
MATATATGRIAQVIGSTFDAEFDEEHLPNIYNALVVDAEEKGVKIRLTGEVQQQLGGNRIRCVALGSTDGLVRGMPVIDTGGPVTVPVGRETLGRV